MSDREKRVSPFHGIFAMNVLTASLGWCLAKPSRSSISSALASAIVWPFVNGQLEGRKLLRLAPGRCATESDLLSVLAFAVASAQAVKLRQSRRSSVEQ